MKKIYESEFNSWDERGEAIIIYELDEGEHEELKDKYWDEKSHWVDYNRMLEDLGYCSDYWPAPGAMFSRFYIGDFTTHHLVIEWYSSLNV